MPVSLLITTGCRSLSTDDSPGRKAYLGPNPRAKRISVAPGRRLTMLSLLWCQVLWGWWSKDHDCTLSWEGRPDEGCMRSLHRLPVHQSCCLRTI